MLVQFIFAFLYSVIFAFILTYFLKRHGPGPFEGILYFFSIIILFTLALGAWLHPIGPMYRNVPWLSLLAISFLIMLLIAELLPHKEKHMLVKRKKEVITPEEEQDDEDEEVLEKEFKILFWIILFLLIAAIIYAFMYPPLWR